MKKLMLVFGACVAMATGAWADPAAVAEIVEAEAVVENPDPEANQSETDRQAQEDRNALKNAGPADDAVDVLKAVNLRQLSETNWFNETPESVQTAMQDDGETQDGVWSNLTDQVEVDAGKVVVDADDATAVAYRPNAALRGDSASITLEDITFTAARKTLPALDAETQAAVAITTNAEGGCVFAVANGGEWEVTAKPATIDGIYKVKVDLHYGDANTVDYSLDQAGSWAEIKTGAVNPVTDVKASTVEIAGSGSFKSMSGARELANYTISFTDIPEGIADITVDGTSVDQDGKATVVEGAEDVVIGFVAKPGYRVSPETKTLEGPITGNVAFDPKDFPEVREIDYVAQIVRDDGATTNKFETADEAFAEAEKTGGRVEIFATCEFAGSYVFTNADVEISVAADVTLTRSGTANYPFKVYNRKTLTFSGEGTISKGSDCGTSTLISIGKDDNFAIDSDECGHVVVNGGNIIDEGGSNACSIDCGTFAMNGGYIRSGNTGGHAVRVSSTIADGSAAVVTLNAGRLEAVNSAIGVKIDSGKTPTITAVPGKDDTAIITGVKGKATYAGTITMKLDAGENLLFSNDKSEFAPRGYGYVTSETVTGWFKLGLATYTITAESGTINGGASATYSMNKVAAQGFALVAAQPEAGKKFKAWTLTATSVQGEDVTIADPTAAETTLTVGAGAIGNYTVTATYETVAYSITYTTGNAAAVTNGVTEYTVETDTFALPAAADIDMNGVVGVEFGGWTNATGAAVSEVVKGTTGDLVFFAKWEAIAPVVPTPQGLPETEKTAYDAWATDPAKKCPADKTPLAADADRIAAYLLNCVASEEALAEARAAFKITSIAFENGEWAVKTVGQETGTEYGNGVIRMGRYRDVECKEPAEKDGNFFKAKLDFKTAN